MNVCVFIERSRLQVHKVRLGPQPPLLLTQVQYLHVLSSNAPPLLAHACPVSLDLRQDHTMQQGSPWWPESNLWGE